MGHDHVSRGARRCDRDAGIDRGAASLSAFAVLAGSLALSTSTLLINGVTHTLDGPSQTGTLVGPVSGPLVIGDDSVTTDDPWTGEIVEFLVYPTALSAPDIAAISANIAAYYGITLGAP